jgi:hypothetical protein
MQYLIITRDPETGVMEAFYTKWFDAANNYNPIYEMVVVDLFSGTITFDGTTWQNIEYDHL